MKKQANISFKTGAYYLVSMAAIAIGSAFAVAETAQQQAPMWQKWLAIVPIGMAAIVQAYLTIINCLLQRGPNEDVDYVGTVAGVMSVGVSLARVIWLFGYTASPTLPLVIASLWLLVSVANVVLHAARYGILIRK